VIRAVPVGDSPGGQPRVGVGNGRYGVGWNVLGRIQRIAFRRSGERHRRAQAGSASTHRSGRPMQRKKTQPSTSNIGEAHCRCSRCDYAQRGAHGSPESESRHTVTHPGLSDLSAQGRCQKLPRSAPPTCAGAEEEVSEECRTEARKRSSHRGNGLYGFSANTDAAVLTASSAAGKPAYTAICRIISKISSRVQPTFSAPRIWSFSSACG
jgi:hypothetical protein